MPQTDEYAEQIDFHLTLFHRRYVLGNDAEHTSKQFSGWSDLETHLVQKHNAAVILPVYMYEHGGIRLKVGSFVGLLPEGHAEFDSGQVGFIWATKREVNRLFATRKCTEEVRTRARQAMVAAVSRYDDLVNGLADDGDDETSVDFVPSDETLALARAAGAVGV